MRAIDSADSLPEFLDWEAIRRRLAEHQAATERRWRPDGDDATRILAERARALARPATSGDEVPGRVSYLEFVVGRERYGVDITDILEVAAISPPTPVPSTPAFVAGIVSLRGRVISAIDLAKYLGRDGDEMARPNRIIVLASRDMVLGILATTIDQVRSISGDMVQDTISGLADIARRCVAGITRDGVILLDAGGLLTDPEIRIGGGEPGRRS